MNRAIKSLLTALLNKKKIGKSHTPEHKQIVSKTKWLNKKEKKEFDDEYKELISKEIILRLKKKTKKSSDWHISLNPKKLKELREMLELE